MASAGEEKECLFCFSKNELLINPKRLPCSHVCCLKCLTDCFETNSVINCPSCNEVYDTPPDFLSDCGLPSCDFCVVDGQTKPADVYCSQCDKKFCTHHQQTIHKVFKEHVEVDINAFVTSSANESSNKCDKHADRTYNGACKVCLKLVCPDCMFEPGVCVDGAAHHLLPLSSIAQILKPHMTELRDKMFKKEEELSSLYKKSFKETSEFHRETKEMVELMHTTRDEQVEAIKNKYSQVEEQLTACRRVVESKMVSFMEDEVDKRLTQLTNERKRLEARIRDSSEVELVMKQAKVKDKIEHLLNDVMPKLAVNNVKGLQVKGQLREPEVVLTFAVDVSISSGQSLSVFKVRPINVTSFKKLELSQNCRTVFYDNENAHIVGYNGLVYKLDDSNQLTQSGVRLKKKVNCARVYDNKLYSLNFKDGFPCFEVATYDMSGKVLSTWPHVLETETSQLPFAVVSDQVIIPDRSHDQLTVYSLNGETIKHIPCPLGSVYTCICTFGTDSVVVSHYGTSTVCKVNITSGHMTWTSKAAKSPIGVVSHDSNSVFVYGDDSKRLYMLDGDKGEVISDWSLDTSVDDMVVYGDMIIAVGNQKVSLLRLVDK